MKLVLRLLINSLALMVAPLFLVGVNISNWYAALITAIFIGLINAVIRPILLVLTLPISILTLGLFSFVINGLMILFVSSFVKGFAVSGLWTAILLSLWLWLISWISNELIFDKRR
jgi:putative membrane protein